MMRSITKCFGLVLLVLGVACSSNQKNELPQGYLATHIFDNGSKQFVYTVDLSNSAGRGKQGNGRPGNVAGNVQGSSNRGVTGGITAGTGGGRGGRGQGARGQHSKDGLLVDSLEAELKNTNYCRNGYMELDRMTEPSQTFIKGECVDAANKRDRSEFPNEADDSTL